MDKRHTSSRGFVPPDLQLRIAESGMVPIGIAVRTASFDATARRGRRSPERIAYGYPGSLIAGNTIRVFDLQGTIGPSVGDPVRASGDEKPSNDPIVEAVLTNAQIVQSFYADVFGLDSVTGDGLPLEICVHYGDRLNNALWDGVQCHFGDGDGHVFLPFALSLEVVAHELSHAMIEAKSGLLYDGESGALNESFADVMAAMIVQRHLGQSVDQANWYIGADALNPNLGMKGVRSFKITPAFENHEKLGSDTQPKHYADYVNDPEDNGGVHANSGIPNHAFYLAATRLGGNAWERAGLIWFEAFSKLVKTANFEAAAQKTVWTAEAFEDPEAAEAFREAWRNVGVKIEA